jgi:penicillin-binding protein 2
VTALAGIERGIITPDFKVHCGGSYRLGRRTYRCWKKEGHGDVDVHKALVRSCDVFFYRVAHMLKPSAKAPSVDVIAFFARGLGLGMRTQIPLEHEATGLVPTAEWKERVFREKWMDGESISLSIGQGANQWTPMQLAMAYAAIGNGGTRYKPQLIRRVIDPVTHVATEIEPEILGKVPVSERALQIVRQGLDGVVNEASGTAYWSMKGLAPGIRAAGKTGTAQVINMAADPTDQEDLPEQYRDHAWFAAFAPVETPRIAIAILVENGGHGGSTSAPIAKALMNAFFENEIKDAQPQLVPGPSEEPAPLPGTVRGPLRPGGSGAAENTVLPPVPGSLDIPGLPSLPAGPRPPVRPARSGGSEQARVIGAPEGERLGRN